MNFTYKLYSKENKEYFEYGAEESQKTKMDSEIAGSLLDILDLEIPLLETLCSAMAKSVQALYPPKKERINEQKNIELLHTNLKKLSKKHLYFKLLELDWIYRLEQFETEQYDSVSDLLPIKEISQIPSNLQTLQVQIGSFIKTILDSDAVDKKITVQQRMAKYYSRDISALKRFSFLPITTGFERIDEDTFTEIFEPKTWDEPIIFFLKYLVTYDVSMRVCKSCGKYFPLTGYANAEYCNREFQDSGKTCKEVGAVNLLQNKLSTNPIHKAYNKAYKTRFARIKYRKITKEEFSAWSVVARDMRDKTLDGGYNYVRVFGMAERMNVNKKENDQTRNSGLVVSILI